MDDTPKITIQYTCPLCNLVDRRIEVQERADNQGIGEWMEALAVEMATDHDGLHPDCHPSRFTNVRIPTYEGQPVGRAPRQ
ncbi:MAG: hypothetical protein KDG50_10210 [Chromatiales bacterium]|nr:hypothetical protein [Chromatiales bacterium]